MPRIWQLLAGLLAVACILAVARVSQDTVHDHAAIGLISAVARGDGVRVEQILNSGGNPDSRTECPAQVPLWKRVVSPLYGRLPALSLAARHGDYACARKLLDAGASVNLPDSLGETPLHWAAGAIGAPRERLRTIELLVAHGALVNAPDSTGHTPLSSANAAGAQDAADLLRKFGGR